MMVPLVSTRILFRVVAGEALVNTESVEQYFLWAANEKDGATFHAYRRRLREQDLRNLALR